MPDSKRTTIRDIAAAADVGISTVSRVLNADPLVKTATRERVLEACRELNYVPNEAARMLVKNTGRHNTVALLMPVIAHQYFYEIISSLQQGLGAAGIHAMVFNTHHGEESVVHHIIALRMSAVVVLGGAQLTPDERELLRLHHIHLLFVDRYEAHENCLTFHNRHGGKIAAEYLLGRGCRTISMIGIHEQTQQLIDRFTAFRETVASAGVGANCTERYVPLEVDGYRATRELLAENPATDAVFYFSDLMAYGGLQARRELHKKPCIIGYDDIFPSRYMELTTVAQSSTELGVRASRLVMQLLEDGEHDFEETEPVRVVLEPQLVVRAE